MTLPKTPSFRLDGQRALVTGAGRGIGLALAAALAEGGAAVTLAARTADEIAAGAAAIRRHQVPARRGLLPCRRTVAEPRPCAALGGRRRTMTTIACSCSTRPRTCRGRSPMLAGSRMVKRGCGSFWRLRRHKFGSSWFRYFNSPMGEHVEYEADMDKHDGDWVACETNVGPETSQMFLLESVGKWSPGGCPPQLH